MASALPQRATETMDELFSPSLIDDSVQKSLKEGYTIRPLHRNDDSKGFFENLKSLTWVGEPSHEQFLEHFDWMNTQGEDWFFIVVIEHQERIVGNGKLMIEPKAYVKPWTRTIVLKGFALLITT